MNRKNLFESNVHQECLQRLEKLTPTLRPNWGIMTSAQMISHCAEVQEVSNGKALRNTPFVAKLFKGMIRKMVLGDKPFPRSAKTHPQYRQVDDRDFDIEKQRLLKALELFLAGRNTTEPFKHPLFGEMTDEERGWAMYKHLDHHLTQFGI